MAEERHRAPSESPSDNVAYHMKTRSDYDRAWQEEANIAIDELDEQKDVEMVDLTTKNQMDMEEKHETNTKPQYLQVHDNNNNTNKTAIDEVMNREVMKKLNKQKSILDTTLSHGERIERIKDMFDWRFVIQNVIAGILALSTFVIQWLIWRYLEISQCEKDIIYLSYNNFASAIFEGFQNGFCWMFGFIYLITSTIIDDEKCEKNGVYNIPIRKIRFRILCITTFIAFILGMFISFIDPVLYYIRFPTFMGIMIISYHCIILCSCYRRYFTVTARWLLLPALVYILTIAFIFALGLIVVYWLKESDYAFAAGSLYCIFCTFCTLKTLLCFLLFCVCLYTVYPIYIGTAQAIAIMVMKNYHRLLCCCKKRYLVESTYDPNSRYQIKEITERYVCEDGGDLNTARRISILTNNNNQQTYKIESNEIKWVDGRGVEMLWADEWIYFICGLFIVFIESMRISGVLVLRDDVGQVALSVATNILIEVLSRNALIWEFIYKCICKKNKAPDRCKFDMIYYGAMWQWTYLPMFLLLLMNILSYGPTNPKTNCDRNELQFPYDILPNYWWMFIVIYLMEVISDFAGVVINWFLRYLQWIPVDTENDGARKIYYVRMGVFGLASLLITALAVSENGFEMDLSITNLLQGQHSVIDDIYYRFFQ